MKSDFAARVDAAAAFIASGANTNRRFDGYFEMYDGDAVVSALLNRVEKRPNTKLALNIWRYISEETTRNAARRKPAGLSFEQWADELRAAADLRWRESIKNAPAGYDTKRLEALA